MPAMPPPTSDKSHNYSHQEPRGLVKAVFWVVLGGVLIGVIGAAFRVALAWAESARTQAIEAASSMPWVGWLVPVLLGLTGAALGRYLIRFSPLAAGSGVQHVEAVMHSETRRAPWHVLPVKFLGGLLAIGGGLALGREGPTIQMGAVIGSTLSHWRRMGSELLHDMQAALGGAGLAVAFNAPVGGVLFVFEEVSRSFRLRLTLLVLAGVGTATAMSRWLLGNDVEFPLHAMQDFSMEALLPLILMGAWLGWMGTLYNRCTIGAMDALASLRRWPVEWRAGAVGVLVGGIGWFSPQMIGGGEALNEAVLTESTTVGFLLLLLVVRWLLGPLSYAAGTPGGIFSPLLLVGAALGVLFAGGWNSVWGELYPLSPTLAGVAGMAAFFTGIVRAPLTGVMLMAEMAVVPQWIVPLLIASAAALLTASLTGNKPIYDTLRERLLAGVGSTPDK